MSERTVINVGAAPLVNVQGRGQYLDGDKAAPRDVTFTYDDTRQALVWDGGAQIWHYSEIRQIRDQAGGDQIVLRTKSDPVARLVLNDPDDRLLIGTRAKNLGRYVSHVKRGRLMGWAMAAVASVVVIIFVLVPILADQLADYLPPAGEKALGDATFEQIRVALDESGFAGLETCENPEGLAALRKIETRLTDEMVLAAPLTVHVLDHDMVNAFALPGGYVVFFRGLIEKAGRPEEVAAVFAHEIGHVAARDPTRIALRSAGSIGVLGLLFGDFAGGAIVLFLAEQIIRADYTQDAEAGADTFAYTALLDSDLPPSAIGTFFERLAVGESHSGILQHFQSHPALGDRIAAARAAEPEGAEFRPLLTDQEWQALRDICN